MEPDEEMSLCERHCYHEAGHALMMNKVGITIERIYANCKENSPQTDGRAVPLDDNDYNKSPRNSCLVYVAGAAATKVVANRENFDGTDPIGAYQMANKYIMASGEFDNISDAEEQSKQIRRKEHDIVDKCKEEAREFFLNPMNRARLDAIATQLKQGPIESNEELLRIIDSVS